MARAKKATVVAAPPSGVALPSASDLIEVWPLARLNPYAGNARKHPPEQIEQLRASLRRFGQVWPLLVREDGTLIAGHGRAVAAKAEGLTELKVIVARGWSEERCRAFTVADNKLGLGSEWDEDLLRTEMAALAGFDEGDIAALGFGDDELTALLSPTAGSPGLTDPDATPEPPAVPIATRGDLWALGPHRLICGDSTSPEDTSKVLAGIAPHLMVTDPPYGVKYDPAWREGVDLGVGKRSKGKVANDDRADWTEAWALFPGRIAYVWHSGLHSGAVEGSLVKCGFALRAQIIWVKQHFVLSRGDYHWQHEPCWYAVRDKGQWAGDRKQTTVWEIKNNNVFGNGNKEKTWGHGTQKPVECMKRPIENNSSPGQAIYEPFAGSGTTIIAAEMTGRVCHAIELDPGYVDVCIQRWQEFTGLAATLLADGRTFAAVTAERRAAVPAAPVPAAPAPATAAA